MIEILISFGAGFISFLSPCVLPLIPGYISFISGASLNELLENKKINIFPLILFTLGFSFVFIMYGAAASYLGQVLLQNSQTLRIIAGLSEDESMINAFKNKRDIHTETAAKVFNVETSKVDREMRNKAKMVNFGIIYGISAFGLSQRLGIKRKEAGEIIESYFREFPKIKQHMDNSISFAKENGYVETILKRKRYLSNINSGNATVRGFEERNAINAPIQGSAADIIKIAMINIFNTINKEKMQSKLLMQVHDELVFELKNEEEDKLRTIVRKEMMEAIEFNVPLEVEIGVGENWLEAH